MKQKKPGVIRGGDIVWAQILAYLHLNVQNLGGNILKKKCKTNGRMKKKWKTKFPMYKICGETFFSLRETEKIVHQNRGETFYEHKT